MDQWVLSPCGSTECAVAALRDYAAWQFNAVLWIALVAVTVVLARKVAGLLGLWAKAAAIPGPSCHSFYGHLAPFSGGPDSPGSLADFLAESHERYGSVVKLWLGPTQLLVSMRDPILIKEMLLKAGDKLPLTARTFCLAFGSLSLFASSYDHVHSARELLAEELKDRFSERGNVTPKKIVDCLLERIHGVVAVGSIESKVISQHMAFILLGATLFGDAFLDWSKATIYEELLMKIANDACFWSSHCVIPFWKQEFWRYQILCTELKCLTQEIIQQCRPNYMQFCQMDEKSYNEAENFKREAAPNVPSSSGGVLLSGYLDTKEELCGNIMGLMFHGCLTTANLISNILVRVATEPKIQENIYAEIIKLQKVSEKKDWIDVEKMLLLLATIYESARLLPAGPLLQRCSLKHDLNIKGGLTVPAGAMLVVPIQLVHTHGSIWGTEANQFNPYRFLSKCEKRTNILQTTPLTEEPVDPGGSFVLTDPNENETFLSFGYSKRACVGQKIAILGIAALFASLLEQYEVRLQQRSGIETKQMPKDPAVQIPSTPKIEFMRRNTHKK